MGLLRPAEAALVAGRRRRPRQVRVQLRRHLAEELQQHLPSRRAQSDPESHVAGVVWWQ